MNTQKQKPVVGQTLYALTGSNRGGDTVRLEPVKVMKVGRKWFYTARPAYERSEHCWNIHPLASWIDGSSYGTYETEQGWADQREANRLNKALLDALGSYGNAMHPLAALRIACDALGVSVK